MSTTSSSIYVQTQDLDRLLKGIEAYQARWAKSVREQWPDVPFLGNDTARTTRILPPLEGWCCLVDPDPYTVDLEFAKSISAALGTRVVAMEVRGGELVWTCVEFDGGRVVAEERDPPEAFDEERGSGQMPMYADVVREALKVLQGHGVPKEYWLIGFGDFVEGASTEAQDAYWVDEIINYPQLRDGVKPATRTLFVLKRHHGSVSFRPDLEALDDNRQRLFVEIRTLFGTPDHQVVNNLLEVERADTNRLLARFMGRPDGEVPHVQFEYSGPGVPEGELKQMLALRREDSLKARPTERQFLKLALEVATSDHPEWQNVRPDGFGLKFERKPKDVSLPETSDTDLSSKTTRRTTRVTHRKAGFVETRIDLSPPYEDFMSGRLVASQPEAAARSYLAKAAANLDRAPDDRSFSAVADLVIPCLVSPEEGARLSAEGVATRLLGHGVMIVLSCQVGEGSALIEKEDLVRWDVSFLEALKTARANLARISNDAERGFTEMEVVRGRPGLADLSGEDPATRILLPDLSDTIKGALGVDEVLCAIPDLDSFFVVGGTDEDTRAEFRAFARERLMAADSPLTAELFRIRRDSVEEA
jgi:hypothetical protein